MRQKEYLSALLSLVSEGDCAHGRTRGLCFLGREEGQMLVGPSRISEGLVLCHDLCNCVKAGFSSDTPGTAGDCDS
jgi:hypothetical protein